MRALPTAFAVSAVLHGVAIAWVQLREPPAEPERPVALTPIEIVPPPAPEPPPTEVTLLDDHSVAAIAPAPSSPRHTEPRKRDTPRITTGTTTTPSRGENAPAAPDATQPQQTAPPHSTLMTMRHPTIEKGPSAAFWDKFAANTKPLQQNDVASEQLADDIASAETNLGNPKWIANATPRQVAAEREKLLAKRYARATSELKADGAGTKSEHRTFKARFNGDGTVASIDDGANVKLEGLGGSFDATDALMRKVGIDPYSSAKLKVLDDTRDERVALGKRYRTQQLAQSRRLAQKQLDQLWTSMIDPAARKQALFELWDDCAETGTAELVVGGRAARSQVVGFIRSRLPAGSAHAYTEAELDRFNKRRRSRATFAPYEPM